MTTKIRYLVGLSATFALAGCSSQSLHEENDAPVSSATGTWNGSSRASASPQLPRGLAPEELARIDRYLGERYPASAIRATIADPGGATFDCVDKNQQPGMAPGEELAEPPPLPDDERPTVLDDEPSAPRCPRGTVRIQRITREQVIRAGSLRNFMRKLPGAEGAPRPQMSCGGTAPAVGHDYAVVHALVNGTGISSLMSVWRPAVANGDLSLSQIWASAGSYETCDVQTVEAGWAVNQALFNDLNPHLFIYWTADAYQTTGCYNQRCPGFLHSETDRNYVGMPFTPSVVGGAQSRIRLRWELIAGKWWLTVTTYRTDGTIKAAERIGYYPATLFPSPGLRNGHTFIEFGGEMATNAPPTPKRTTDMGSGISPVPFTNGTLTRAASHSAMSYSTATNGVYAARNLPLSTEMDVTSPACYNGHFENDPSDVGIFLYFGGAGNNGGSCR